MKKPIKIIKFATAAMLISTALVATVSAQDDSATPKKEMQKQAHKSCFIEGEKIVDNSPKRKASEREQKILDKTIGVINRFDSQKDAFTKLDHDHNCQLDRSEVKKLLGYAKVKGIVQSIASGRLITQYDLSHDGAVQWREFHHAVDKAIAKQEESEKPEEKSTP